MLECWWWWILWPPVTSRQPTLKLFSVSRNFEISLSHPFFFLLLLLSGSGGEITLLSCHSEAHFHIRLPLCDVFHLLSPSCHELVTSQAEPLVFVYSGQTGEVHHHSFSLASTWTDWSLHVCVLSRVSMSAPPVWRLDGSPPSVCQISAGTLKYRGQAGKLA